ncbi:zinc ribbon domain-containing protein [candidate division KSB1 bacterium]
MDKKLLHLELSKGDLPKTVKKLKEDIENITAMVKNSEEAIEEIEQEKRKTEGIVGDAEEKLKKFQNQLYDVTSNKEYDAITHEIEVQKKEIEEGETKILELLQSKEENETKVKEYNEEIGELDKDLKEKEKELKNLLKTTEKKELELNQMREKIVVRLDKPVLKRYERIRAAKNGIAVVTIERDACGGCYKTIPPQNIVEVEKLNKLHQCEVCGRILVPQNELDRLPL